MLTTKAAEVIPCDILILESTYGHPNYVFPRLGQICAEMVNWTLECVNERKIPVFQVYSTGKAQEVIKILNKYTKIPVVVHPIIAKVNQAYLKNEIKLTYIISNSKEGIELINKKNCVFIVPNNVKTIPAQKYSTAVATGWALKFNLQRFSRAFPLSGHADFKQLVDHVKQTQPKKVFTIHGFKDSFANYLHTKLGIKAQPIKPLKQRLIHDYL
jgi:putative mRNA 3-end processing factor